MNEDLDIFVYSHKKFTPRVKNPVFKILTNCHDEFDNTNLEIYRDYEGEDNIADKNLMYNEYTGLYWLWKNYDFKKYIGLNHYRRYYSFFDNVPNVDELLQKHTMLLNRPVQLQIYGNTYNNRSWYGWWHNIEDFDILEDVFREKYPEYMDGFKKMKLAKYIYNSSMFTIKSDTFKEYCEFIFSVLKDYIEATGLYTSEEWINFVNENKDKYIKPHLPYYTVEMQSRVIGYVAERAMNAFFMNGKNSLESGAKIIDWIQTND